jgi:hypothetical protein
MTREEILALPAGRKLDRLVAAFLGDREEDGWWVSAGGTKFDARDGGPRHYSTDIAAAWDVAGALRGRGDRLSLHDRGTHWTATVCPSVRTPAPPAFAPMALAPTAPLALCRVALLAALDDTDADAAPAPYIRMGGIRRA